MRFYRWKPWSAKRRDSESRRLPARPVCRLYVNARPLSRPARLACAGPRWAGRKQGRDSNWTAAEASSRCAVGRLETVDAERQWSMQLELHQRVLGVAPRGRLGGRLFRQIDRASTASELCSDHQRRINNVARISGKSGRSRFSGKSGQHVSDRHHAFLEAISNP
jgi:hypothetical protein